MDSEKFRATRFRKLKYRSKYIDLDFAETKEIFLEAKREWAGAVLNYCDENKLSNPLVSDPPPKKKPSKEESTVFSSTQIKDLYRKIAIASHPDKLGDSSEEEVKFKTSLLNKAAQAKQEKDIDSMLSIALELEIDISSLDMRCLDLLEKQLDKKENEIKEMRKDIAWQWYYSGDFKRNLIISKICPKPSKEV